MCTAHGRMLIAATLCCRGPKIEAAAAAVATVDDKEFAKELYRNLVVKKKALLAIRDKLLECGPDAFPPPPFRLLHFIVYRLLPCNRLLPPRCTACCPECIRNHLPHLLNLLIS